MKQSEENNQNQQDTINDYNNNIFKSYNPQFNHQDSNLKFYSIISDRSSQLKSQMLNVQYNCEYCQKKVEKQQIILQCLHTYHEDCLKEFFQNQILQKKPILNCLCNNKITNINKMKFLEDRLLQQLYKNQLNAIEEKYQNKFRKCNKCRFMHIEEKQMQQQQKICYQCGIEAHY
ncbi:unnamed protein product [Paramecium sonneborni]|uniref:WDR59/RTC1-like RING zinc finger domain-containing protein n=1 Tax=Paramecium sonneborni TaxID=65129 RepID=A0A8S1MRJ3_9CILI|nr:unnamed protein product [Paramecium sonneborni]